VILVDTGPIVALLRRPDQHHERCVATLQLREPLATVWPVVTEAMFLLADRPDVQAALWRHFETDAIRLLPLGRDDVPRVRELMWKYRDRRMDFADAAVVRVAERDGIDTVFTVDRRDFAVYRLSGRRRIKMLP
jgi:predicted nucleic acid-binding protein